MQAFFSRPALTWACRAAGLLALALPASALAAVDSPPAALKPAAGLEKPSAESPAADLPVRTGIAGAFLSGQFARANRDLDQAARFANESLRRDPANPRLQREAMRLNLLAGRVEEALAIAHQLQADKRDDTLANLLSAVELTKEGRYREAQAMIATPASGGLLALIQPALQQWLRIGVGGVSGPVSLQSSIDKVGFFAPFLTYQAALMNDVLGNTSAAEAGYAKALEALSSKPYRVAQAAINFYLRQKSYDKAQQVADAYARQNPDSALLLPKIVPGEPPKPLIADARDGVAELLFTTASLIFSDDASQDAFLYLRLALALRPDLPPGQLMLATLYEQTGDYARAIAVYDSIAGDPALQRRALMRKALNLDAQGDRAAALELLDTLIAQSPGDPLPLITKGDFLREAKSYDEAATAYSAAIERSKPLSAQDWPLLYARGICYERAGNWNAAEADFLEALRLDPRQPEVLNYLSYSWLLIPKNIEKAKDNLELAVSIQPENAHIIDSLAWADFLTGDYAKATKLLEHAVELMPDDPTVNDHLGDVYWRTGRENEARYQWERVLLFKPEKDQEAQVREKLANGLPAEGPALRAAEAKAASPRPAVQ